MLLAPHRQPFVEVPERLYHIEELGPDLFPAPRLEERFAIAYEYEAHAGTREEHV